MVGDIKGLECGRELKAGFRYLIVPVYYAEVAQTQRTEHTVGSL